MRLNSSEINAIRSSAKKVFGNHVRVVLFGSRVDESKKGGDIDLLIDTKNKNILTIKNKIEFLVQLKSEIGDQKIDVILNKDDRKPIIRTALQTGITIC